jgi:hypothetical protein
VPSYSAISQPISGLGLGATGPYMNAAFIASGVVLLLGVVGVVTQVRGLTSLARWITGGLLALTPLGMILDGIFTLESFMPHFLGYLLGMGGAIVAFFVAGRVFRRDPRWHGFAYVLPFGGALTLLLFVVAQVTFDQAAAGANVGIAGLTERILIVDVCAWFVLLGLVAYLLARSDAPEGLARVERERPTAHRRLEA